MVEIHCHHCGGFINDPRAVSHLPATDPEPVAGPHSGLCTCGVPTVYEPPEQSAAADIAGAELRGA